MKKHLFIVFPICCAILLLLSPTRAMDWHQGSYDDDEWSTGFAPLGFDGPGVSTVIESGRPTYYFRKLFYLPSTSDPRISELRIIVETGEGVIV